MPDGNDYEFESDRDATKAMAAWKSQFRKNEKQATDWSSLSKEAANPFSRFLIGMSSPIRGAMELIPGDIGNRAAEGNRLISETVEKGKSQQSDIGRYTGNVSEFVGNVVSPPFVLAAKMLPAAKTIPQLMRQGGMIGGLAGLTAPTGESVSKNPEGKVIPGIGGAITGGIATPVVGKAVQGISNIASSAISGKSVEKGAAKLAVKASGKRAQDVVNQLKTGPVEGTAAETALPAKSSEFSSLIDIVKDFKGSEFGDISREAAKSRLDKLRAVAPDLAKAIERRKRISDKYYKKADKAVVAIDDEIKSLFDRMPPETMAKAERIARMRNKPFVIGEYVPAKEVPTGIFDSSGRMITIMQPAKYPKITGESLHYIKEGLSDIANAKDAATGIGRNEQRAAREVIDEFVGAVEKRIPSYRTARRLYAKLSEPVNQSNTIQEMASILEKPGGGERTTAFMNVLGRGENALLKKTTGYARYEVGDLKKVLTPAQYSVVKSIENDLKSGVELSDREIEGMKSALRAIRASEGREVHAPRVLNQKVAIFNDLLNRLEGIGGERTQKKLAELAMPGNQRKLAELMQKQIDKPQGRLSDITKYQGGVIQQAISGASQ